LGHGHEAVERHADRRAEDAALGERRVDDAVVAELVPKALGDAEDAADAPDVLAEDDDPLVLLHLEAERVVDRLDHVHLRHVESSFFWFERWVVGAAYTSSKSVAASGAPAASAASTAASSSRRTSRTNPSSTGCASPAARSTASPA